MVSYRPARFSLQAAVERPNGGVFAESLHRRYRRRLGTETLMLNELYLAVSYRPVPGTATGLLARALARRQRDAWRAEIADALDACDKLAQTLIASLARYEPEPLGCYRCGSTWYSSLLEYFGLLVNGERQRIPLPRGPLNEALASTRLFFGTEAIEYRTPTETRVGAVLGIKEYPTPTVVGMYDRLLTAPLSFVLTQSFAFLSKATGQALLQRQFNRMVNAGDFATSQTAELKDALDALTSNEFVMGDHHFSLQLLVDVPELDASEALSSLVRLKALNDQVAQARASWQMPECSSLERISRSKRLSGHNCLAIFHSDRASHLSLPEILQQCPLFTIIRWVVRTAIIGDAH